MANERDTQTAQTVTNAAPFPADAATDQAPIEEQTSDPTVVRTTRTIPAGARASDTASTRAYPRTRLVQRYGGFYWGAAFIGFVVALFFAMIFLGVVGAVVGGIGYQLGQPLPKFGQAVSSTSQNLGIAALVGSLLAIFLAYLIGGYTAGRMARFDGAKNGLGVVIWTIIITIVLGAAGAALGSQFNVASQLHLKFNPQTVTIAGALSAAISILVMIIGAGLGGSVGERFHRDIDTEAGLTT